MNLICLYKNHASWSEVTKGATFLNVENGQLAKPLVIYH